MELIKSAGIIIVKDDNPRKYLLLQYPHGHWDFAKGKLEGSETNKQAALRELKEETGLTAEFIPGFEKTLSYNFSQDGQPYHKTVTFFIGLSHDENVEISDEHIGYAWLPYQEAVEHLTFENAKDMLNKTEAFLNL